MKSAFHFADLNSNIKSLDQGAYINSSIKTYNDRTFLGGRNRMPVYMQLMAFFYNPEMNHQQFFEKAKKVNIYLSVLILIGLCLIFSKKLSKLSAATLVSLTAFTVFIFYSAYVRCELLFYFLFFISFLSMLSFLKKPGPYKALGIGFLTSITYLTKMSMFLGALVFLAFSILYWIIRKTKDKKFPLYILIMVASFLLTASVYLIENTIKYKIPFYNVNSTFYVWYDSWEEAKKGTRAHGDRVGWPKMKDSEVPSMTKYLKEHSVSQIIDRLKYGIRYTFKSQTTPNELIYFKFVIFAVFFAAFLFLKNLKFYIEKLKDNLHILFFSLSFFIAYFMAFSWYVYINTSSRFILTLYLPFMFLLFYFINRLSKDKISVYLPLIRRRLSIDTIKTFYIINISYVYIHVFYYNFLSHKIIPISNRHVAQ